MEGELWLQVAVSALLVLGTALFVSAEYALVSSRKTKLEGLAKAGNRSAKKVIDALGNLSKYVAAIQVGITLMSIGIGSLTEPFVTHLLNRALGRYVPQQVGFGISLFLVTYVVVVVGELVPKYVTLHRPERAAMVLIHPIAFFTGAFAPLVRLIELTGTGLVRLLGIDVRADRADEAIPREEMLLLVKAGSSKGVIDKVHAEMVSKAMQLDRLTADDIMVHRLDMNWIDADLDRDKAIEAVARISHTRIPVCRGDIDEVVGILYVNDLIKYLNSESFSLEQLARPPIFIPENLTLDRIVTRMREDKTQMLIVVDEYGGTSGLVTLEDVIEEVFGELEDSLESERPSIEVGAGGRVSARAEVRFDELVDKLGFELEEEPSTDTLATLMVDELGRMPKLGDVVRTSIGELRVENMARRRVTRVSLQLSPEYVAKRE